MSTPTNETEENAAARTVALQLQLQEINNSIADLSRQIGEVREGQTWLRQVLIGKEGANGLAARVNLHSLYFKVVAWGMAAITTGAIAWGVTYLSTN